MRKVFSATINVLTCLIVLLLINTKAYASHILGAELRYKWISGLTYQVTVYLYGDCSSTSGAFGTLPTSVPRVCIYDGSTAGSPSFIDLAIQSPTAGMEITPVCPDSAAYTTCSSLSNHIPGIKKFVYSNNVTLSHNSANWRFIYEGFNGGGAAAGRTAAITNLFNPAGTIMQLIDTLNTNTSRGHNSSPVLTVEPTPFFCTFTGDCYNPGAVDFFDVSAFFPDGDSLAFSLVTPTIGTGGACSPGGPSCTYMPGLDAWTIPTVQPVDGAHPIQCTDSSAFSFDGGTGQLCFTPSGAQRSVVVYNIEEFLRDTLVGTMQREMNFLAQTCTAGQPTAGFDSATAGTIVDSTDFKICQGAGAFSITLLPNETDTLNSIWVSPSGLPTGASYTTVNNGTRRPVCTFSWSTSGVTPGVYIFYVTYEDNNCPFAGSQTTTYTITINPLPASVTGVARICSGTTVALSDATSGGTWSSSGSTVVAVGSGTGVVAGVAAGTAVITYTISATGCAASYSMTVDVSPPGLVTASGPLSICTGNSVRLTADVGSGYLYQWSQGGSPVSGATNISYTAMTSGAYYVRETSSIGCSAISPVYVVTVIPLPPAITGASSLCQRSVILLSDATPGGTWSSSNMPVADIGSATGFVTGVAPGTATIYYTITLTGCSVAYTITVNPLPAVAAGAGISICPGASAVLSASGAVGYAWSPGSGLSCTSCATTIASPVATTIYTVAGTGANGCVNTDTVRVTIKPLPSIVAGTPASVCLGASTSLSAAGGVSYVWSPGAGLSCTTCANPLAAPIATTVYTLTGTGANGCANTDTVRVAIKSLPVITISPAAMCSGTSTTLSPSGGVSYSWSPGSALSCTACTNPVASPTVTSVYSVTGTGINGCINTTTVTVNVGAAPPQPGITSPVNYCLNATAIALSGTGSGLLWYTTPTGGAGSGVAPTPSTAVDGTFTWYVTQTVGGCESPRASVSVVIKPLPVISVSPVAAAFCIGQSAAFTAGGGISYTWSPGTALAATTGATVTANPSSSITYTVTGTGINACTDTASATVKVYPLPVIAVTPTAPAICTGSDITLTAGGALTYTWASAATLSSSTGITVTASPLSATTYTITGTDAHNCVNTGMVSVSVNPIPPAPVISSTVSYCRNAASTPLSATGTGLLWYTTPTGGAGSGTAPTPLTAVDGTFTWYVTQTVGGCESPRASVSVVIKPLPVISVSPVAAAFCIGQSAAFTAGGGISYTWSPGTALAATTGATVTANPSSSITYTVTGTGINGCTDTASATVTVYPLPVIAVTPTAPAICTGSDITLTAGGALTYTWASAATLSSSTGISVTASPLSATTYTITGTDAHNCVNTGMVSVSVNPIPPAPVISSTVSYCRNAASTPLSATGTGLLWYTTPTGGAGSGTAPTPLTAVDGTFTWYVTQTVGGCESPRASVSVVIKPLPVISVSPAAAAFCTGQSATFTAGGGISYTWGPGTALAATTGATVTANPSSSITYTVTGTGINGCTDTASATVTVYPLPVISVTPSAPAICTGSAVTLTAGGALTYTWASAATLSSSTGISVTASPLSATTYTITGTDAHNCVNTGTVSVSVNPIPPAPVVSSTVSYCRNAAFVPLSAIGTGLLWYTTPTGGAGSGVAPTPSTAVDGTFNWYVTQKVGGCESPRASVSVVIKPLPVISVSPAAAAFCAGQSATFTAGGGISYTWGPGTALAATTGATVTANPSSSITYTVTGTGINGCTDTASSTVTVYPLPVISVTPTAPAICTGSDISLTAGGALTYTWASAATLSSSTGIIVTASPLSSTTYTITGTDAHNCVNTGRVSVSVNPIPPMPVVGSAGSYCRNAASAPLSATGTGLLWYTTPTGGAGSGTAPTPSTVVAGTFTWYVTQTVGGCESPRASVSVIIHPLPEVDSISGPKNLCNGAMDTLKDDTPGGVWSSTRTIIVTINNAGIVTTLKTGIDTISYTVTNAFNCSATVSVPIFVDSLPNPGIIYGHDSVCLQAASFMLSETENGGKWESGNPGIAVIDSNSGKVTPVAAGTAVITYMVSSAVGNCPQSVSHTLVILPRAAFTLAGAVSPVTCNGSNSGSVSVTATGTATYQYAWSNGAALPFNNGLVAGIYTIKVTDTNTLCYQSDTFTITQPDSITITAEAKNEFCRESDGSINIRVTGGIPPYTYLWPDQSTASEISGLKTGNYLVTVTDSNLCARTMDISVGYDKCTAIIIHNIITPNGDGINDSWVIEGLLDFPDNKVKVFDKWGNLVFSKDTYQNDWKGIGPQGEPLPDGTYYYLLEINATGLPQINGYPTGYIMIKK